jgi:hypothetical protein
MFRRISTDWEQSMQSIIQIYAGVADQVFSLNCKGPLSFPGSPITLRKQIVDSLNEGSAIYKRLKESPPKGNQLVQARFSAYRLATSSVFGLLCIYFEVVPWISAGDDSHKLDAQQMTSDIEAEIVPWFMAMRDIPVIAVRDIPTIREMTQRMSLSSASHVQSVRQILESWGERPIYSL